MIFITDALEQLRWINLQIDQTDGTDRRALESARDELMKLIWAACEKESSSKLRQ
jgi:hypothetical protein